jgi:hypothetical protein
MQISGSLPHEISIKSVNGSFIELAMNQCALKSELPNKISRKFAVPNFNKICEWFIYRPCYESMCLKIGTTLQNFVEVCHTEFQQNLRISGWEKTEELSIAYV